MSPYLVAWYITWLKWNRSAWENDFGALVPCCAGGSLVSQHLPYIPWDPTSPLIYLLKYQHWKASFDLYRRGVKHLPLWIHSILFRHSSLHSSCIPVICLHICFLHKKLLVWWGKVETTLPLILICRICICYSPNNCWLNKGYNSVNE